MTQKHLEKLKSYLDILKTKIEFILLDIPPLLQYSEGIALSKLCDGIILVIEAGETRWEIVQQANRLLEKAHVNLIGGVLNRKNEVFHQKTNLINIQRFRIYTELIHLAG